MRNLTQEEATLLKSAHDLCNEILDAARHISYGSEEPLRAFNHGLLCESAKQTRDSISDLLIKLSVYNKDKLADDALGFEP